MNLVRFLFLRRFWIATICALSLTGCGRSVQNDPVAAMNHFFALLSQEKYQQAYDSTSVQFQLQLSEANFEALIRDLKMGEFSSVTWTPASITDNDAHLNGAFVTTDNKQLVLAATVVRSSGGWKLFSMQTPSPNDKYTMVDIFNRYNKGIGFDDAFTRKLPGDDEAKVLVRETMLKFNECLHSKNFDAFYQDTSALWQSETTPEMVARAFKPFVEAGITVDFVKDVKPIFDQPPRFDGDGHLVLQGYYPSTPNKVVFTAKYIFELPKWKLLGITVNFKP